MFINRVFTHANVPVPASSTSLTTLLASSNISIPANANTLLLQAQTAGVRLELDGSTANATTSYLISANDSLSITRQVNNNWFGDINVIQDGTGATLRVDALGS